MLSFNNILINHSNDNISLSSLVQNMMISYFIINAIIYFFIKNIKQKKNNIIKLLKNYYIDNKYKSFVIDTIFIGILYSISFLLYKILYLEFYNKISPLSLFFIILNISIICLKLLFNLINTNNNNFSVKFNKISYSIFFYDIMIYNIISIIGFSIILLGYNNIIIPPVYIALLLKYIN